MNSGTALAGKAGETAHDGEALGLTLRGTATTPGGPLQAPASGSACVHWRLRIVQRMEPGLELVHEFTAPEPFELAYAADATGAARRARIPVEARLEVPPVLHRPGSPGAAHVATLFGLQGDLRVEEIAVRADEVLEIDGVLVSQPGALDGPFRSVEVPAEIAEAVVRVPARSSRPNLLPWALGTAAALVGSLGVAGALSTGGGRAVGRSALRAVMGPGHAGIGAPRVVPPRWP